MESELGLWLAGAMAPPRPDRGPRPPPGSPGGTWLPSQVTPARRGPAGGLALAWRNDGAFPGHRGAHHVTMAAVETGAGLPGAAAQLP